MANTTYGSPYVQSSDLVSGWPATSLTVADRIDDVSFKGNGVNNQTATYTTVLTDAGKTIVMNVGSANDLTIQASGTAAYEIGTMIRVVNKGAGLTTVKPAGGVTLNGGNITLGQNQSVIVLNLATDVWNPLGTTVKAGQIVQVVQGTYSTSTTVASTTYTDTGLTATITPTSATNKILVMVQQQGRASAASAQVGLGIRLLRGATAIFSPDPGGAESLWARVLKDPGTGVADMIIEARVGYDYLDSPATTSATTYKIQGRVSSTSSGGAAVFQQGNSTSIITLCEVVA